MTARTNEAEALFKSGNYRSALTELAAAVKSNEPGADIASNLLGGLIYEYGGDSIDIDLAKAEKLYYQLIECTEGTDSVPYFHAARVLIKRGGEKAGRSLLLLKEAYRIRPSYEVVLGFAHYYEHVDPDLDQAMKYYMRAARAGRFMGFFGVSRVLRRQGKAGASKVVSTLRIVVGPFVYALIGKRSAERFI